MAVAKAAEPPRIEHSPMILDADPREAWFAVFAPTARRWPRGVKRGLEALGPRFRGPAEHEPRLEGPPPLCGLLSRRQDAGHGPSTGAFTIWETASGKPLKNLREHTDWIRSVSFSPDGKLMVASGQDRKLTVWEPRHGRWSAPLPEQPVPILWSAISPDGKLAGRRRWETRGPERVGGLAVYDLATLDPAPERDVPNQRPGSSRSRFRPTARRWQAAAPARSGSGTRHRSAAVGIDVPHHARIVAFSPDGTLLLTAGTESFGVEGGPAGGTAFVWDVASRRPKGVLGARQPDPGRLFSPDGRLLATASGAGPDVRSGTSPSSLRHRLRRHGGLPSPSRTERRCPTAAPCSSSSRPARRGASPMR